MIEINSLKKTIRQACDHIAPVWPLQRFVAVNPYLGFSQQSLTDTAAHLQKTAGARLAMPLGFYLDALAKGLFTEDDLKAVFLAENQAATAADLSRWLATVEKMAEASQNRPTTLPTVVSSAAEVDGFDWPQILTNQVARFAGQYFDEGEVQWSSVDKNAGLYAAWREEASIDRTPEIFGLKGFRQQVQALPDDVNQLIQEALDVLAIPTAAQTLYLERLLRQVGGFAAYSARIRFEAQLAGEESNIMTEFLGIQMAWEIIVYRLKTFAENSNKNKDFQSIWMQQREILRQQANAGQASLSAADQAALWLQKALDQAAQRRLLTTFNQAPAAKTAPVATTKKATRPAMQAIFCIDVRSEVFRRHLEALSPDIETLGFAGFFAFAIDYQKLGEENVQKQYPVLLTAKHRVLEISADSQSAAQSVLDRNRLTQRLTKAWWQFKSGAIACFSFVSPLGIFYLPKLVSDTFGWTRPIGHPDAAVKNIQKQVDLTVKAEKTHPNAPKAPTQHNETSGIPMPAQIDLAENALRAMSLTENFAPLVLITGHGASVVNNAHASGLDCGACGGHSGEANARLAATILNDTSVRTGLAERGIAIPADTFFLACQHDTTTDQVSIFNEAALDTATLVTRENLAQVKTWLAEAGRLSRAERAQRLPNASADPERRLLARSRDWAELRAEWGLAGCQAFVAAPRQHSAALHLDGQVFLHSYNWQQDQDFTVLEVIMTAPMVVASWISLQYYASTVDNVVFGCGNKTLHNIVGNVGVLEGNNGDLRVGLPWQSLSDGAKLVHWPRRLQVVLAAPLAGINRILERHPDVRALVDNQWLGLLAMNDDGKISHRYQRDLHWTAVPVEPPVETTTSENLDKRRPLARSA